MCDAVYSLCTSGTFVNGGKEKKKKKKMWTRDKLILWVKDRCKHSKKVIFTKTMMLLYLIIIGLWLLTHEHLKCISLQVKNNNHILVCIAQLEYRFTQTVCVKCLIYLSLSSWKDENTENISECIWGQR